MRRRLAVAVLLAGVAGAVAPAVADQVWIAPAEKGAVTLGSWAVTANGIAHFDFAAPDSLDELVAAEVIVIGSKSGAITYEAHLAISRDGEHRDAFTAGGDDFTAAIVAGELAALDVTSLFPALAAGEDVVALHFRAIPPRELRVVGLLLTFTRVPDQAGLGCGPREVLAGFTAAGAPICVGRNQLLEGLLCPPEQFLVGFDPVTGQIRCGDKRVLLAGLSCPPGEFLVGFDDLTGDLVCKPFDEVVGGGGGGEEILIAIDNLELTEGNTGTTSFVFSVSLSAPSAAAVTVDFSTRNGTAQAGSDFVATSGTLTFAPGELNKPLTVLVSGDTTTEDVEVFFVDLTNAGGAVIGDAEGVGRIFDDDGGGGRD